MTSEVIGLCADLNFYSEPTFASTANRIRSRLEPISPQAVVEVDPLTRTTQQNPSVSLPRAGTAAAPNPAFGASPAGKPSEPSPNLEWLRRLATAVLETTHSLRQVQQLRAIASPAVVEQLSRRRHPHLRGKAVSICALRVAPLRTEVLEVSCTFSAGTGFYPMAFRMELTAAGWRLTACEIGPH